MTDLTDAHISWYPKQKEKTDKRTEELKISRSEYIRRLIDKDHTEEEILENIRNKRMELLNKLDKMGLDDDNKKVVIFSTYPYPDESLYTMDELKKDKIEAEKNRIESIERGKKIREEIRAQMESTPEEYNMDENGTIKKTIIEELEPIITEEPETIDMEFIEPETIPIEKTPEIPTEQPTITKDIIEEKTYTPFGYYTGKKNGEAFIIYKCKCGSEQKHSTDNCTSCGIKHVRRK